MFNVSPGDCAGISNGKGVDGNSIALLVPLAFENADAKPGHCGCLEATILHEATHNVMNTNDFPGYQNNAYDATKSCISCAQ